MNWPLVERGTREREKQRACSQAKERTGARETRKGNPERESISLLNADRFETKENESTWFKIKLDTFI